MDSLDIETLRALDPMARMEAIKQQLVDRVLIKNPEMLKRDIVEIVDVVYNAAALHEVRQLLMSLIDQLDDLIPQEELSGPIETTTRQVIEENPIRAVRTGIMQVQKSAIDLLRDILKATGVDYQVEAKVVTDGNEYQRPVAKA